mgnify:FL=1
MGLNNYGTVHLHGIDDSVLNATISAESFEDTCANVATVEDESGNVIERRMDDVTTTGTFTLIIRASYTIPAPGTTFDIGEITYIITGVGRNNTARGFRIVEVKVITSENITLTP